MKKIFTCILRTFTMISTKVHRYFDKKKIITQLDKNLDYVGLVDNTTIYKVSIGGNTFSIIYNPSFVPIKGLKCRAHSRYILMANGIDRLYVTEYKNVIFEELDRYITSYSSITNHRVAI